MERRWRPGVLCALTQRVVQRPPLNLSRPQFPHWKIEGILWRAPGHCLLIYNSILWQPFSKCAGRNPGDANQDSLRTELCYQTSWKSFIMVMRRSSARADAQYGGREGRETLACGRGKPGMKIQAPRAGSLVLPHFWLRGRGWGGSHSLGRHVFKPFVQPEIETREGPRTSSVQCSPSPLFGKLSYLDQGHILLWPMRRKPSWRPLLPALSLPDVIEIRRGSHTAWGPSFVKLVNSFSLAFCFLPESNCTVKSCVCLGVSFDPFWVSYSPL